MGLWQGGSKHIIKCKSLPGPVESSPGCQGSEKLALRCVSSGFSTRTHRAQAVCGIAGQRVTLRQISPYTTVARALKCKLTPRNFQPSTPQFCFLKKQRPFQCVDVFDSLKRSQVDLTLDISPSISKYDIQHTAFVKIGRHGGARGRETRPECLRG